ncbi:MAG: c-type cytochrome biogenesis protein CcmI [Sulfitobacter sp.]
MSFWITTIAMSALVALLLGRAMWRGANATLATKAQYDVQVYRDQLAEVERDVARGVVGLEDAERVRTEISRRILAADASGEGKQRATSGRPLGLLAVVAVVLMSGSAALYSQLGQPGYGDLALADRIAFAEEIRDNRPSQKSAEDSLPPVPLSQELSDEYKGLIQKLRDTVADRPDDLQGHRLLAQNEANIGNFAAAARAQKEVLRIIGADASPREIGDYGELLVLAAGGYVSPDAETALRAVLVKDREDGRALYYIGLMMVQTGRPDIAFRLWDRLLRRGPADAPWIAPIREQIMPLSQLAGVDYTLPTIGDGASNGPSADDIEAASEMTAEDRMAMIGGMVEGLSNRLATEGGPPRDWARLITSLGVLNDRDQALAVFNNAMQVFEGDAGALDIIRTAGSQAGVAE